MLLLLLLLLIDGDLGGDGVSNDITLGLAGQPELDTDEAPGVVDIRDCALLDEILALSKNGNKGFS